MECDEYLRRSRLFRLLGSGHTASLLSDTRHVSWETASFAMALGDVTTWSTAS